MTSNNLARLCFVGAGNMAQAIIGGLIDKGHDPKHITACDINTDQLARLEQQYAINTDQDTNRAIADADAIVLAVKPQVLREVCQALNPQQEALYISIAAGIRSSDIERWLGDNKAIVRCMPNTPALLGLGATGLFANSQVNQAQRQLADGIIDAIGISVWVSEENELDAVTAISGSGPAYFFLFIEALENAAKALGLDDETAAALARQTALGASSMAIGKDVVTLRQQVTSKGGTTEQAIASFQSSHLEQIVLQATRAAQQRSVELAELLSKD